MRDSDQNSDDTLHEERAPSEVGDVEDAGETTAADTINGPSDTRPVGADTMLKVSDADNQKKPRDD